ncbi:cilia- and flagella-associated protein 53 isoform X2 [Cryptotermes secundus]|nr:cilia- and flagella-associated protein 53 isoform X2 [Cryptotermes secundus]
MLLGEEQAWTKEYVEKEQRVNEKRLEEMRLKVEEIRNKREAERQKLVQEKRIQQYFERCEDLRSLKSQRFTKEAKRGQEYQMKEQEYIKEQEGEVERMWAEMTQKEYEAKVAREIEEARKKFERDKEVAEVLLLQRKSIEAQILEERQRIKDEEEMMKEKIEEEIREEKMTALENKIKAREKMYNDLMEQIRRREDFLNSMAKEEEILEETFCQVAQDELEKELASRKEYREAQKREWNLYRDSVAQLRRQRAAEEAELEKILQQERNKIEAERKEKLARLEAARQKLKDEVLQGRKVQVEHQKEMAEKLKKEEEEEFKLQELVRLENARLTAEHDNQIRLLKRKYAKDLRDQIEYSKMLKAREREEIERDWKAGLLEEECYKRLIKELLSRREEIEPHPFWRIIDASASLDGPCRCSVPEAKEGGTQRR